MKKIVLLLVIFSILSSSLIFLQADSSRASTSLTYVSGHITSNTTWNLTNSPYIVTDNVTINNGAVLTIEPGVTVKLNIFTRLIIKGGLIAKGNKTNIITFTSNQTTPKMGDWSSIKFDHATNDTESIIEHCKIEYPVYGIWCIQCSPIIKNNIITNAMQKGIYLKESNSTIENNTISDIDGMGIDCSESYPIIKNNVIKNQTEFNIKISKSLPTIQENVISNSIRGIYSKYSSPIILDNYFTNLRYSIWCEKSSDSTIFENQIIDNEYGIYCIESNCSINNNIIDQSEFGIYCMGSSPEIIDSPISNSGNKDFHLTSKSHPVVINSTFSSNKVILTTDSTLTIKNHLRIKVENESGAQLSNADVEIKDNDVKLYNFKTNNYGLSKWVTITDRIYYGSSSPIENVTTVTVSYSDLYFPNNPRSVDMSFSHTELFKEGNAPPEVKIIQPVNNQIVNGTVFINGTAFDFDGTVVNVELQIDSFGWAFASSTGSGWSTWSYQWDTTDFPNANYTINARAKDNNFTYSYIFSINLQVENYENNISENIPPVVTITSHEQNEIINGTVVLYGTAFDDDTINATTIQIDDGPWYQALEIENGWSIWGYGWDTTIYPNGEHTVNVRAVDNENLYSNITSISLIIDNGGNIPPLISITSFIGGEIVGDKVNIEGTASDYDGTIEAVEIQIDNNQWQNTTSTNGNWSTWIYEWDTTEFSNGKHILKVRAYDGFDTAIDKVGIIVDNGGNMPPILDIILPQDKDIVKGLVSIRGTAEDIDGTVHSVEVQIDDNDWKDATSTSINWFTWSYNWDTTLVLDGEHTISVRAFDNSDVSEDDISVIVDNPGNSPPIIDITSHKDGDIISGIVNITGISKDTDGVVKIVEIQINTANWINILKADSNEVTWNYIWDTKNESNIEHTIKVRAFDGFIYSKPLLIVLTVRNVPPLDNKTEEIDGEQEPQEETPSTSEIDLGKIYWMLEIIIILIIILIVIVLYYFVIKKGKKKAKKPKKPKKEKEPSLKKKKSRKKKKEEPMVAEISEYVCPNCDAPIDISKGFCNKCGAEFEVNGKFDIFCPHCDAQVESKKGVCGECGGEFG